MSHKREKKSSLGLFRDKEFAALAATAFARSQAYSTILIALALYAQKFGTTGTVEGLFGTAFAAAQLVIVLPLGRYIDIGNSKNYLLGGLLINIFVLVGFIFVSSVEHIIVLRVFQGIGATLLWITGTAVVGEISPDEERGLWIGSYNQVAALSSLAGDLFGGFLLYVYGFEAAYVVLIFITTVSTVAVFVFLRSNPGGKKDPEEATGRETLVNLLGRTAIRALVLFRSAFSVGKMAVLIFLPIYARKVFGINPLAIGGILAGGKLTKSLFQGRVGDLTDRVGNKKYFILGGALLYGLGVALIPLAGYADSYLSSVTVVAPILGSEMTLPPAFFVLFGAYSILGVADSLRLPASMTLFVEEGEHYDAVAGSLSLRSISWKVGQISGPFFVGVILDFTNYLVAFWIAAGFIVFSALVFTLSFEIDPPPEELDTTSDELEARERAD